MRAERYVRRLLAGERGREVYDACSQAQSGEAFFVFVFVFRCRLECNFAKTLFSLICTGYTVYEVHRWYVISRALIC